MQQPTLSPIVAGCMKWGQWGSGFTTGQYVNMISACADNGISSFDHADIYGDYSTEEEFGKALHQLPGLRNKIQLITKCGIKMPVASRPSFRIKSYNTSKEYIIECAERSLSNLHTDYIDAFLIHRPDPLMNPEEIAEAFTRLKQQGKILHAGVSNFTPSQTAMLHKYFPVEINQIEVSLLYMDPFHNGQLDQCQQEKIVPMAWSPLGGGQLLTDTTSERNKRIVTAAAALSDKYATNIENILLAFLHRHPSGIIPVLGTSKIERLQSAMAAAGLRLEAEEWFMLWEASAGKQVP
ncbi:MAG: aldo/keto reductase [Chitinophagaceae bacterium]|nr:aldo/keto reductase [Chitinophagaceae bacterium]